MIMMRNTNPEVKTNQQVFQLSSLRRLHDKGAETDLQE